MEEAGALSLDPPPWAPLCSPASCPGQAGGREGAPPFRETCVWLRYAAPNSLAHSARLQLSLREL